MILTEAERADVLDLIGPVEGPPYLGSLHLVCAYIHRYEATLAAAEQETARLRFDAAMAWALVQQGEEGAGQIVQALHTAEAETARLRALLEGATDVAKTV